MTTRRKPQEPGHAPEGAPVSPAVAAALSGLPASLVRAATYGAPSVRLRLERFGPGARALETNVARAPIFAAPSRDGLQLALSWEAVPVHGGTFVIREARGPLSPREEHLLGAFHTAYVQAGCPDHRRVALSLGDAARILGHRGEVGGRNRELVKESLRRIAAISLESTVRYRDEAGKPQEDTLGYRLVDGYYTSTRGAGRGSVTLSEPIAALIRAGSLTFLQGPVWEALLSRDLIAARLWTYLEAEHIPAKGWAYALWASPPGEPPRERSMPAIAGLLRLRNENRSRVAGRIREACDVIAELDPRYELRVVKSPELGMYRLEVSRAAGGAVPEVGTPRNEVGTPRNVGGLPKAPERDPEEYGRGTLRNVTRDPEEPAPERIRGAPSSLPLSLSTVEAREDRRETTTEPPRSLAELLGPTVDRLGFGRSRAPGDAPQRLQDRGAESEPEPSPEPLRREPSPAEIAERRRVWARTVLADPSTPETVRETARGYLEPHEE